MELTELRIFKAVAEQGGITKAAAALNRVQSNVTTRVKQLEERLGTRLFHREGLANGTCLRGQEAPTAGRQSDGGRTRRI